ncbi:MAG TPA: serine/threonine-protein kinase [Kofleriaceae bacterium]
MMRYPPPVASDPPVKGGDDLGRTATAPGASTRAEPAEALGSTLGRYRLERELGEGGMGVVHAAYDPDLQRRIALKVLRIAAPSLEAKDRLLREARAMARLAHPNVVTVHEVGTANGRDYVAMELVLGDTLADWLRSEKQRKADVVAAFLAAGRGLAAAHAAGIVHRDFKPHNVLRSRAGRIVVTDFGLAREATAEIPHHDSMPIAVRPVVFPDSTPSSLSGITATGSLLGTPAYMAPEQWAGGAVTPATDQFAYCVALWEALAGERPFRGPTLDELRAQAKAGPSARAAAKIPRHLRPILLRGLEPDPADRWPSMDALLTQIARAERRPGLALAIGVGALLAAVVVFVGVRATDELAAHPRCQAPLLDPDLVWPARHDAGTQPLAAALLDRDIAAWSTAHDAACQLEPVTRAPRLWCLDGVLARIDAVARAARASAGASQIDAGAFLIDPRVCELPHAPRLMATTSPEFRDVVGAWLAHTADPARPDPAGAAALVARAAGDPCASALAHLVASEIERSSAARSRHVDEAGQDAERCGDDRVLAETAVVAARRALDAEWLSASVTNKLRLADAAVHRVEQADLDAYIDTMRLDVARRTENLAEALARGEAAVKGYAARGRLRHEIDNRLDVLALRQIRATPDDLAAVADQLFALRARAVAALGAGDESVRAIDLRAASWAFHRGDLAAAHELLAKIPRKQPNDRPQLLTGIVLDAAGRPVPGATVTAAHELHGDSSGAAAAEIDDHAAVRSINTGPDGKFELADAVEDAVVVAELGDRRSAPESVLAPASGASRPLVLTLAPTSRLEGTVDLAGQPAVDVRISVKDLARPMSLPYSLTAPVAADGTFAVGGVPRHEVRVFVIVEGLNGKAVGGTNVTVREPVVSGVSLSAATSSRKVHVLVRSTVNMRVANAEVVVLPGRIASMNAFEMNKQFRGGVTRWARQIEGENAPKEVVAAAQPGDLFATMTEVPDGPATACALGMPELSNDSIERKMSAQLAKLQFICQPIADDASVVLVHVPPVPRLD